jgi:decaprenyl-diphosphate synthase subunit 1
LKIITSYNIKAKKYVEKSKGLQKTKDLATTFCEKALASLKPLKPSPAKEALIQLTYLVLERNN